jgi:hypothetical protein
MSTNKNLDIGEGLLQMNNLQTDKDLQVVSLAQTSSSNNMKQKTQSKVALESNI